MTEMRRRSFFSLFHPLFQATLILVLSPRTRCQAGEPSALQVPVGTTWYGDDGKWSPVNIRVGSPPQWVSVLVSTASQETLVIGTGGCLANDTICSDRRGGLFNSSASRTWNYTGDYGIGLDKHLGIDLPANYGYDNVNLGDQVIVPDQIVGIINSTQYLVGYMGLGIKATAIGEVSKPTFLTTLFENQTRIPSRSYGYTAGASYRLKGVPASLTLGGFDANRFESLDTSFSLNSDGAPVIAINEITVSANPSSTSSSNPSWSSNPLTLLGPEDADLFTIDSSTPFLWLPERVCDQFANALGLQYNETLQVYTFDRNTSQHDTLADWNMTFTFRIADLPGSAKSVNITLPYAAFDLQLIFPFPGYPNPASPPKDYFPLRRAANETQYTIGRAFLQESYLMVDYERNNFSISQAKFAADAISNVNLVSITRPENSTDADDVKESSASGLSKGSIAAIIVGVAIGIVAVVASVIFYLRRRHRQHRHEPDEQTLSEETKEEAELDCTTQGTNEVPLSELVDHKFQPTEVPAEQQRVELAGNSPAELPGSAPAELEGSEVASMKDGRELSPYRVLRRKHGLRVPTSSPARSAQRHWSSSSETATARTAPSPLADSEPEPSPVTPAHSPARVGRGGGHSSNEVSPQSSQATTPLFGPFMPSPLTPAFARGDTDCHRPGREGGSA